VNRICDQGIRTDLQTLAILGSLFALVTIIGGIHQEIYRHLPNPGLRLGCFNFVIVPVVAEVIARILGEMRWPWPRRLKKSIPPKPCR
jgi:hypothetical protein